MNKYKVCVYAICKNEEKFVSRWVKSMSEADEIYVLDTGSTDNTVKFLKDLGVHVKTKIIDPWRFDVARNESLKLVPEDTDICVCTDLDEIFKPGWRNELEKVWSKNANRLRFIYNWSLDENNKPIVSFYYEKTHSRKGYKWIHPVHEILKYEGKENFILTDNIVLNHYPDNTKSRGSYLKLLELSVKEEPNDDRNMHYLGREYMYYKKWNKSIDTLIKHLRMPTATWKEERCASMRFISRCYINLNRFFEAEMWLLKAIEECPYIREGYTELGMLYYSLEKYDKAKFYFESALKQKENARVYINEPFCYDGTIYDYLSICEYKLGNNKEAIKYAKEVLKYGKDTERIKNNIKIFESK